MVYVKGGVEAYLLSAVLGSEQPNKACITSGQLKQTLPIMATHWVTLTNNHTVRVMMAALSVCTCGHMRNKEIK